MKCSKCGKFIDTLPVDNWEYLCSSCGMEQIRESREYYGWEVNDESKVIQQS